TPLSILEAALAPVPEAAIVPLLEAAPPPALARESSAELHVPDSADALVLGTAVTSPVDPAGATVVPVTPAGSGEDTDTSIAGGEVISRVQAQNLEHSVYQKLRRDLDERIAGVMQERFLPGIGSALDAALARISSDLRSDIGAMVRGSIEETLRMQLK